MVEEYIDDDLGRIVVKYNSRAKRVIARKRDDYILLTVPDYYKRNQIITSLEKLKPQIKKLRSREKLVFNKLLQFETLTFKLKLEQNNLKNIYHQLKDGLLTISYPSNINIEQEEYQETIKTIIEGYLRSEAKKTLPIIIQQQAELHGFIYSEVKINKSRTRWGSCSSKKSINLSYWCLLLPAHLVDFIVLHELCHTLEMNHGANFWKHLDQVTQNKAKELTNELKQHHMIW